MNQHHADTLTTLAAGVLDIINGLDGYEHLQKLAGRLSAIHNDLVDIAARQAWEYGTPERLVAAWESGTPELSVW